MSDTAHNSHGQIASGQIVISLTVLIGLAAFYFLTTPQNYSTGVDSYSYAYRISELTPADTPEVRLFLWIMSMQVLYSVVNWIVPNADPFVVVGISNAIQAALAVVLMERLLSIHLGIARRAAWLTAGLLATSYGFWRFAGAMEVYASAVLISILLVHAGFWAVKGDPERLTKRVIVLGVCGAVGTLAYQPMGIIGALALPVFLLMRVSLRHVFIYYAIAGLVVLAGLIAAYLLDANANAGVAVQSVLDTDGTPVVLPGFRDLAKTFVAFFQNFMSVNWAFAFEPTRQLIDANSETRFTAELFSAGRAGAGYWVFVVTVPVAFGLVISILAVAFRNLNRMQLQPVEAAALVWLLAQFSMLALIIPGGFEAWIPGIVPALLIVAPRVIDPLVQTGRGTLAAALIAVFVVHNWFAGNNLFASSEYSYFHDRGDPLIDLAGPDDLFVIARNWEFERFLNYTGTTPAVIAIHEDEGVVRDRIEATLAKGGTVFLLDEVAAPTPELIGSSLHAVVQDYLVDAERIQLGVSGHAYLVSGPRG